MLIQEVNMISTGMTRFTPNLMKQMLVGFDSFFDGIDSYQQYPPYNLVKSDDDNYKIEMALAGFKKEDINITLDDSTLIIEGKNTLEDERYIHRGLASRQFKRMWTLDKHMEIKDAQMSDGILCVKIKRNLPEEMRPKKIKIK